LTKHFNHTTVYVCVKQMERISTNQLMKHIFLAKLTIVHDDDIVVFSSGIIISELIRIPSAVRPSILPLLYIYNRFDIFTEQSEALITKNFTSNTVQYILSKMLLT
jgi:hypothetical protein